MELSARINGRGQEKRSRLRARGRCEDLGFAEAGGVLLEGFEQRRDLKSLLFFYRLLWLLCTEKTGKRDGIWETCLEVIAQIAGNDEGFNLCRSHRSITK